MKMYLFCLKCKQRYVIPYWAMKRMTYREYSYCDKCYEEIEGNKRSLFARIFTRKYGGKRPDIILRKPPEEETHE